MLSHGQDIPCDLGQDVLVSPEPVLLCLCLSSCRLRACLRYVPELRLGGWLRRQSSRSPSHLVAFVHALGRDTFTNPCMYP